MPSLSPQQILERFLATPLGSTRPILDRFARLPGARVQGQGVTQSVYVPGIRHSRVLLVAHADTVWNGDNAEAEGATVGVGAMEPTAFTLKDGVYHSTRPNFGLGADDRAGCAILWCLRRLGHSLLVTSGEEVGCQSASFIMKHPSQTRLARELNAHRFAVQFDRRNGRDFKCYEVGTPAFRAEVAAATGYTEPDRHSHTDIVVLCRMMCGVNLSVGYRDEHTPKETLNLAEWRHTLATARRWLATV